MSLDERSTRNALLIQAFSVPHYVVASKNLVSYSSGPGKWITWGIDYVRRFAIEEVYYRLGELDAFTHCLCCGVLMLSHSYHVP